jgi:sulfite exporter TauE/SafE
MPIDWLAVGAAFLTGLLGSGHCAAMCGGIATGFSATAKHASWPHALQTNLGRVLGYVVAGMVAGGIGHGIVRVFRIDWLATGLRMAVGAVLVLAALRLLDRQGKLGFMSRPGGAVWQRLRPLQQRLLPATTAPRRVGLGMLWGWLPCGLSGTLLAAAWLQSSALHGGLTMAAFGLGTLPMMVPLTWSGARLGGWLARPGVRYGAALLVLTAGVLTLAAPWLMRVPQLHGLLSVLGCRSLPG